RDADRWQRGARDRRVRQLRSVPVAAAHRLRLPTSTRSARCRPPSSTEILDEPYAAPQDCPAPAPPAPRSRGPAAAAARARPCRVPDALVRRGLGRGARAQGRDLGRAVLLLL